MVVSERSPKITYLSQKNCLSCIRSLIPKIRALLFVYFLVLWCCEDFEMFFPVKASFCPDKFVELICLEPAAGSSPEGITTLYLKERRVEMRPGFYVFISSKNRFHFEDILKSILRETTTVATTKKRGGKTPLEPSSSSSAYDQSSSFSLEKVPKKFVSINRTFSESFFFDDIGEDGDLFRLILDSNRLATMVYHSLEKNSLCNFFAVSVNRSASLLLALDAYFMREGGEGLVEDAFSFSRWSIESGSVRDPLRNVSDEDVSFNSLPQCPLETLPLVSFDLEVITDNMGSFPGGMKESEKISSISVAVQYPREKSSLTAMRNFLFVLRPFWWTAEMSDSFAEKFEEKYDCEFVLFFEDETQLLDAFMNCIAKNEFSPRLGSAVIYTGYNINGFDYSYLYMRLWVCGLVQHLDRLQIHESNSSFVGKNGNNDSCLSLDIFQVRKFYDGHG